MTPTSIIICSLIHINIGKTKKLLEMNVQFEAGNFMHLCGVDYYQIDKQGSCKFRFKATQFYRALKK